MDFDFGPLVTAIKVLFGVAVVSTLAAIVFAVLYFVG